MTRRATLRMMVGTTILVTVAALIAPEAVAATRKPSDWVPNSATRWEVGGGGDDFRTGYNPTETQPPFINCNGGACAATDDADGPWLEWVTKISDLPSGVWPEAGVAVVDGIVYVSGGATNSFLALKASTGLPIWRFSPDPRTDGATAAYPGSNAPVVKNGVVYATFSNGWIYALNAKTGKKIWSYRATEGCTPPKCGNPPPGITGGNERCAQNRCVKGSGDFDPVHPGVAYPKIHGATGYCGSKVLFMTLSGWVYSLDAKTGKLAWKDYADGPDYPGELTWWEYAEGGALKEENRSAGASTRRFEAVPGLACLNGEVQVAGSDGVVRFRDPDTGAEGNAFVREYPGPPPLGGTSSQCQQAGWNCDIAVGLAIPPLASSNTADGEGNDYIVTTLDSRIIRLDWDTHDPRWLRTYNAPLPFQTSTNTFLLEQGHVEDGFIAQAVVGGPMALDPDLKGKGAQPILYAMAQDGRLYVLKINSDGENAPCLRPEGASGFNPCLLARMGVTKNENPETPYTRQGEGGPWDYNQAALSGLVLGGDVLYVPTWDNKFTAFDVRDPAAPKKVWQYEVKWDTAFKYPPFGDQFATPYADIDGKIFSSAALLGGHLYFAANDGRVYAFNLHKPVKTVRNLVILGSGLVPAIPKWKDALGAFDRVWTEADWYKNQVPPTGYRLPKAGGIGVASLLLLGNAALIWWYTRRDDYEISLEEAGAGR